MNSLNLRLTPRAMSVVCSDDEIKVALVDGRNLSVPMAWFPRLARATPSQRMQYEILGDGSGIHWSSIDEDISVVGLIAGQPSVEFQKS